MQPDPVQYSSDDSGSLMELQCQGCQGTCKLEIEAQSKRQQHKQISSHVVIQNFRVHSAITLASAFAADALAPSSAPVVQTASAAAAQIASSRDSALLFFVAASV